VSVQARNNSNTAPLAIWLTGGPGCSSELAVFKENGPYVINSHGDVEEREYAWDVEVSEQSRCSPPQTLPFLWQVLPFTDAVFAVHGRPT